MAYDDKDRLGIPDFMLKTNTYNNQKSASTYQRRHTSTRDTVEYDAVYDDVRRSSLDKRKIHANKRTKKVDKSLTGRLKRQWKGIALSMGLGAMMFSGVQSLGDDFHELKVINQNPVVTAVHQTVNEHKSRTDDYRNWQLDTWGVEKDVDKILENGGDPLIVLGTLGTSLNESFSQDELSLIVEHSFGENPDTLVRNLNPERYDEGIQDPEFKSDVRNYIVQKTEADIVRSSIDANSELEAMFNLKTASLGEDMKGMGGK